jgi:hypothetical protein
MNPYEAFLNAVQGLAPPEPKSCCKKKWFAFSYDGKIMEVDGCPCQSNSYPDTADITNSMYFYYTFD